MRKTHSIVREKQNVQTFEVDSVTIRGPEQLHSYLKFFTFLPVPFFTIHRANTSEGDRIMTDVYQE